MTFIVSEKVQQNALLLVVTDKDLLGKRFEQGRLQLDLTKEFYQGEEKSREEVKGLFLKAKHLHLTGKEAVALGVELKFVDQDKVLYIDSVPHAEVVME